MIGNDDDNRASPHSSYYLDSAGVQVHEHYCLFLPHIPVGIALNEIIVWNGHDENQYDEGMLVEYFLPEFPELLIL